MIKLMLLRELKSVHVKRACALTGFGCLQLGGMSRRDPASAQLESMPSASFRSSKLDLRIDIREHLSRSNEISPQAMGARDLGSQYQRIVCVRRCKRLLEPLLTELRFIEIPQGFNIDCHRRYR
ncbi:MAG: hypothetical protein H0V63_08860 [Burkholderiaceae bacterium]|nr:hypothetical protein [Burkholderiaceae bacterium]